MLRYVALGDRDQHHAPRLLRRLRDSGMPTLLHDLSSEGASSDDVLCSQLPAATALRPDLVTLSVGAHDVWRRTPHEVFGRRIADVVEEVVAGGAVVVVANVIDVSRGPVAELLDARTLLTRVQLLNMSLATLRGHNPHVELVDVYTVSRRELPFHPEYVDADSFDTTQLGDERLTDVLWPVVERRARGLFSVAPSITPVG